MKNKLLPLLFLFSFFVTPLSAVAGYEANQAPDCSAAYADPENLWPPRHKFEEISIQGVTDPDGDTVQLEVQCIFQDEPVNHTGDGNTEWDAYGINTSTAGVLAERSGNNNGRVYHVDYIATDAHGARCGGEVLVAVDKSTPQYAQDEGRLYESVPSDNECGLHDINNPPYIYSEPIVTAECGQYSYEILANDPDRDSLVFSVTSGPEGLVVDDSTGVLSWAEPVPGTYDISVQVEDERGGTDSQSFSLTILASSFDITSTPDVGVQLIEIFTYSPVISPDSVTGLTYQLDTAPEGMSINSTTGDISWEPTDVYTQGITTANPYCGLVTNESTHINAFADVVAVVDESGSMSGEHAWIDDFVTLLEESLLERNVGMSDDNLYGLVGFERSPREITMNGEKMYVAEDFVSAASQLRLYGGTEDGWRSLKHVVDTYPFREESAKNLILVTDEDRDNTDSSITYDSISALLTENDFILNAVVNARFYCDDGRQALGIDYSGMGYVANGDGGYETCSEATASQSTSVDHYVNLAMETGGAAWDLNYLRQGGHYAASFSAAMIDIKVREIVEKIVTNLSDLMPTDIRIDKEGTTISAEVLNRGADAVDSAVSVSFYSGLDAETGVLLGTVLLESGLAADSSTPATLSFSQGLEGIENITVVLEPETDTDECCLTNNSATVPLADLLVANQCHEDRQYFTVNVFQDNTNPEITSSPVTSIYSSEDYSYQVLADDSDLGDALQFSLITGPDGMEIDASSGLLSWAPEESQIGVHNITLSVMDLGGLSDEQSFELTVNYNNPPVVISEPPGVVATGEEYRYTIEATDEENHALSYYLLEGPDGMSVERDTGLVTWTPSSSQYGNYTVRVVIKDELSAKTTYEWTITSCRMQIYNFLPSTVIAGQTMSAYFYVLDYSGYKAADMTHTVTGAPEGMTITASTYYYNRYLRLYFNWTPTELQAGTHTITVEVSGGCQPISETFDIKVILPPTVELTAEPQQIIIGESALLSWNAQNAETVTISPDIGSVDSSGGVAVSPLESTTYTITATGEGGSATASTTVIVEYPEPTVSLSVDRSEIIIGESATLSWDSQNAEVVTISPDIGTVASSGSVTVSPTQSTTYTISVSGWGRSATASITINVIYPEPTVSLGVDRSEIIIGESATLSWDSQYAEALIISPDIGTVASSGSVTVSTQSTTYTISASGWGGSATASTTITVIYPEPTVNLSVDRGEIIFGESATLSWDSQYAEALIISPDIGTVASSGSVTVSPTQSTTYTISASGWGGSATASTTINVTYPEPTVNLSVDQSEIIIGESATLSWSTQYAETVTIEPEIGTVATSGTFTFSPSQTTTYTITAGGQGGSSTASTTVTVIYPEPTVSFSVDRNELTIGESAKLSWNTQYAETITIEPDIGTVADSGSLAVSPTQSTTYTITATSPGGSAASSITVAVTYPEPTVNLSVDRSEIIVGESATLSWSTQYAETVAIDPDIGTVAGSGSLAVSPAQSTTYTITATSPGGSATSSVTVAVTYPEPTVSLSVDRSEIIVGESATLSWSTQYAETVTIDPDIGTVAGSGSVAVSPAQSTTYTITATGQGGTGTSSITVTVIYPEPLVNVSVDQSEIMAGESATLSWSTQYAETVTIDPDIGTVAGSGSLAVSPTQSTTYTVTATGQGGTGTSSITVTVIYPEPTVSLSVDQSEVNYGESAVLSWTTTDADSVSIAPDVGAVALNGSAQVTPTETTTYTLTATGQGGTTTTSVTVTVYYPQPTLTLSADKWEITRGESVVLVWTSSYADTVTIEPDIGTVELNGTMEVTPTETTSYTVTASGPGGSMWIPLTVTVNDPPAEPPTVAFVDKYTIINPGETTVLSWTSTNADSVEINQGIGTVDPNGSLVVSPTKMVIYTITATSAGGSTDDRVRVFVDLGDTYSYGDPTPAEQAHLEAINNARQDPAAEAARLGIDLNEGLADGTIDTTPKQPVTFNSKLLQAAYLHSLDMVEQQYYTHDSLDGRTVADRILEAGYNYRVYGENLGTLIPSSETAEDSMALSLHDTLFIDAGVDGRGHRLTILNHDLLEIGVGLVPESPIGATYGCALTDDFASSADNNDPFILGVVYDDQNANSAYDAGEGIQGVEIAIVGTGDATLSATAGGYAIPVGTGSYLIRATLDDGQEVEKSVDNITQNTKVDFLLSEFSNPAPRITFTVDSADIVLGDSVQLLWNVSYADSASIDNNIGAVETSGSLTVTPGVSTTYTLTATGPGGTSTKSVTVTVQDSPVPSIIFTAAPQDIYPGDSTSLLWDVAYADAVSIDNNIGAIYTGGSLTVSPAASTTYTLTASGSGGTSTKSITVTVKDSAAADPYVSLNATPSVVAPGGTVQLSWTTANVDSVFIEPDIGQVAVNGTVDVSPEHTTIYTIVAVGSGGSATDSVTVTMQGNAARPADGSFGYRYGDLIPGDAVIDVYDDKRFAIITGKVNGPNSLPLADVLVSLPEYPEYGTATTDADGRYSLPVEGGGLMRLAFSKNGYIAANRQINVPWNDIAVIDTLEMTAYDDVATDVAFNGDPDVVTTHRSTMIVDEDGSRALTMVFRGDNQAYVIDADGNDLAQLSNITVRGTEFTAPESMPAQLPPTSFFTYCAELSVDGARRVRFKDPVVTWVDNFLGFAVGTSVPSGYFDRDENVWKASDNGVVVTLLDTDGDGVTDALDADGDWSADDLNGDGRYDDEVAGLTDPAAYAPGATFWRVEVTHFTPYDYNFPSLLYEMLNYGFGSTDQQCPECEQPVNSSIGKTTRTFSDDYAVPGTGLSLHYASNRTAGHKTVIRVPVSGAEVTSDLKRIFAQIEVAGVSFAQTLAAAPNQVATFVWDGTDYLGRYVDQVTTVNVSIGYVYESEYMKSDLVDQAFGLYGLESTGVETREDVTYWKKYTMETTRSEQKSDIASGWSLSAYHRLDPTDPDALHKGDGSVLRKETSIIGTVIGNGEEGSVVDGATATDTPIPYPSSVVLGQDGNIYVASQYLANPVILKVDGDGVVTIIAGGPNGNSKDDGIPALEAAVYNPYALAMDSADNLYLADMNYCRVRKIDTDGIITTVAGTGTCGDSGDNGKAVDAEISPTALAVDDFGNVYISERDNYKVKKIDTNGIITTVAGSGEMLPEDEIPADGEPAILARLDESLGLTVDNEGNLYIASNYRIRRVNAGGTISTVVGNGTYGYTGDNGLATDAAITSAYSPVFDDAGNMYFSQVNDEGDCVRKVTPDGYITTVAGTGTSSYSGDEGPASRATLSHPRNLAVDGDGVLYVPDWLNHRVRKIAFSDRFAGENLFTDPSGVGYRLSDTGLHEQTIDLNSGVVLLEFSHDANDNLTAITDRFGNQVTIERDSFGVATAIISADGVRTDLTVDNDFYLTDIDYPDSAHHGFEYSTDGLMVAKVKPNGHRVEQFYDETGRVTDALDNEGGHWQFYTDYNSEGERTTVTTSAEGNVSEIYVKDLSTGGKEQISIDASGVSTSSVEADDGLSSTLYLPDGTTITSTTGWDQYNSHVFTEGVVTTSPSGLQMTARTDRSYRDDNDDGQAELITSSVTVNNKTATVENDLVQGTITTTSPMGRTSTSNYDPATLLVESVSVPGLHDAYTRYDSRGRVMAVESGSRATSYTYNTQGWLQTVTDPENRVTSYTYDAVGRLASVERPDNSFIRYQYDANGNMTVLTTPTLVDHGFDYNNLDRNTFYNMPLSGSYQYVYDLDRRLIQTIAPSGEIIDNIFENNRLRQSVSPYTTIDFSYLEDGRLLGVTNGSESITHGYDGSLVTDTTLTGTLNAVFGYTYNDDFALTSFSYAGASESYTYDDDGLLTMAGAFTINRNADNGLPESVTDNTFALSRTFNGYGEVSDVQYAVNGSAFSGWSLTRDLSGRITDKTGGSTSYHYGYDLVGRLTAVTKDGVLVEEYQYDDNGNRVYEMNSLRGITGRSYNYSDEDHLVTAGDITFQYDVDGFLAERQQGSEVTTYTYTTRGQLLNVALPDGSAVEYRHDPLGRRIAKLVNGVITEKYLWGGSTTLLAVYDGSDSLVMRFEYADGRMPLAMTKDGARYYLAYDQVGSLRAVTDSSGNVVKEIVYDSFGNIISDSNPSFTVPFGFAGGLLDPDTGLVRFGARDYSPEIGRWTAKDPILFAGGDTNLYGYCLNDPVNFVDPNGLCMKGDIHDILAAAGLIPGVGIAPDVLDALIYAFQAKWGDAGMAVLAAIPAFGQVSRAGQYGTGIAKNLKRFQKKIPANAKGNIQTFDMPNGGVAVQATSPGKVPGSKAVYEKQIDSSGKTTQYTKTTYDQEGNIVHVKDKIIGSTLIP